MGRGSPLWARMPIVVGCVLVAGSAGTIVAEKLLVSAATDSLSLLRDVGSDTVDQFLAAHPGWIIPNSS